ncbi:hypothetical protein D3C76_1407640 [compost metagenome]
MPIFAPRSTICAMRFPIMARSTKEAVKSAHAVEDCRPSVATRPEKKARGPVRVPTPRIIFIRSPKASTMPSRTRPSPKSSSATAPASCRNIPIDAMVLRLQTVMSSVA